MVNNFVPVFVLSVFKDLIFAAFEVLFVLQFFNQKTEIFINFIVKGFRGCPHKAL